MQNKALIVIDGIIFHYGVVKNAPQTNWIYKANSKRFLKFNKLELYWTKITGIMVPFVIPFLRRRKKEQLDINNPIKLS